MLNKNDIINILSKKQFPKNEYWVTAGAGLVMHGVKPESGDIDMGCSSALADLLIKDGAEWHNLENGTRKIIINNNIELFENWNADNIIEIDGFPVASLDSIRKQKVELNREKDWQHIKLIDEFVKKMTGIIIKKAQKNDLQNLLELYTFLHDNPLPAIDSRIEGIWSRIIHNANHHILLGCIDEKLVSSCVIIIVKNLTREQRPYALIENVITHPDYRNKGYASAILSAAKDIAKENNCYKIMLMTSSKKESTLDFYRRAGFNSNDKTAFIAWL